MLGLLLTGNSFSYSQAQEADPYKYNAGDLADPSPVKYNGAEEADEEDEENDEQVSLEGSGRVLRPRRSRSKPKYSGSKRGRSRGSRKIVNYSGKKARSSYRGSRSRSVRVSRGSRRGRRTVLRIGGSRSNYYRGERRSTILIRARTPVAAVCSSNYQCRSGCCHRNK